MRIPRRGVDTVYDTAPLMNTSPVLASEKLKLVERKGWREGEYQYQEAEVQARQARLSTVREEERIRDQGTLEGFSVEDDPGRVVSSTTFSWPNSRIKVQPDKNKRA